MTIRRAVGYVRVSTGEQADSGLGLLAQRAIIESEARRRKWQLIGIFEDAGVSGSTLKRPGLDAVLATLKAKAADTLMLAKQDRLSRTVQDLSMLAVLAKKQGWDLVALNLPERVTPEAKLMWHVDASVAEYYRDITSERTKQALQALRAKGVALGRPVVTPVEVEERIMRLRKRGHSPYAIAKMLTRKGVPTAHGAPRWRYDAVQGVIERVRPRKQVS